MACSRPELAQDSAILMKPAFIVGFMKHKANPDKAPIQEQELLEDSSKLAAALQCSKKTQSLARKEDEVHVVVVPPSFASANLRSENLAREDSSTGRPGLFLNPSRSL